MIEVIIKGPDKGPLKVSKIVNDALTGSGLVVAYYPQGRPDVLRPDDHPNRIYIFDETQKENGQ